MLLQVMREGGSLSLIVDSSLASVHSLGSKPLRLDGILFLGMMTTMLMMMTLINTILNTTLGCKDFFCHRLQPWSLWLVDLIANFCLSFRIPFHHLTSLSSLPLKSITFVCVFLPLLLVVLPLLLVFLPLLLVFLPLLLVNLRFTNVVAKFLVTSPPCPVLCRWAAIPGEVPIYQNHPKTFLSH